MKPIRPRQLVHRGTVLAEGLLVEPALLGEDEARRRLLAAWAPGAAIERADSGWVLRFPRPRWIASSTSPGAPLVRQGGYLAAAPLEASELAALPAMPGAIVRLVGGEAQVVPPGDAVDPADWIDATPFAVEKTTGLGAAPPSAALVVPAAVDRAAFAVPPADPQLASIIAALRGEPAPQATAPAPPSTPTRTTAGPGWWSRLLSVLGLGRPSRPALPAPPSNRSLPAEVPVAPQSPSWFDRLWAAWVRWVTSSRLANLIGKRQAEYLARMMQMFEDGDLDSALRHAIPLSSVPGGSSVPSLGVPSPRTALTIGTGPLARSGSALGLGASLFAHLQQMYRQAVTQLERAGRIEEAAFVLAELLQSSAEAVSFLERHGRLRLAAELAEGRGLAPELVVRQWLVAQDFERAVLIARQKGCFAAAVLKLESKELERGRQLRGLWAVSLAEAGDYAAAVEAVWPIEGGRRLARTWIEQALEVGGAMGARMLARKASIAPDAFDDVRRRAEALCDARGLEGAAARRAFAEALVGGEKTAETSALARDALRAQVRDLAAGLSGATPRLVESLRGLADDAPLGADLPPLSSLVRGRTDSSGPRTFRCGPADVGLVAIRDLALLPGGRLLVALGEAGVRLLTPDGRVVAHFDRPAERLAVSVLGSRAIGWAARGEVWRLSRFDLAARTSEDWVDARFDGAAAEYDGSMWFVSSRDEVQGLDATATHLRALWRVDKLAAPVLGLMRSSSQLAFVSELSLWHYDLPLLRLRSRGPDPVMGLVRGPALFAPWPGVGLAALSKVEGVTPLQALRLDASASAWKDGPLLFTAPVIDPAGLVATTGWVAAAVRQPEGIRVYLVSSEQRIAATFELDRAREVALRFGPEGTLAIGDDRGRALVYHLEHGVLLPDLRL